MSARNEISGSLQQQERLVAALGDPRRFPHAVSKVELLQTHISWLLLTGEFAYKIKKSVSFGFVDFSTLEKRRLDCLEELRLNRRTAPELYLDVLPIYGSASDPRFAPNGGVIEYGLRMRQFPKQDRLDLVLDRRELHEPHVDQLAAGIAALHRGAEVSGPNNPFGALPRVYCPVRDNLQILSTHATGDTLRRRIVALAQWSRLQEERLAEWFVGRKSQGMIRECHGDLHLANLVLLNGQVTMFDCLEFNPQLRWIDVISDLAFCCMDLTRRGAPHFSNRLLNQYLAITGDYPGLFGYAYYLVYRALVRCTVALLRLEQLDLHDPSREALERECDAYVALSERTAGGAKTWCAITHGVSGSGKSYHANQIAQATGAMILRSDVERKRLFAEEGNPLQAGQLAQEHYAATATRQTYSRLAALTLTALKSGFPVIVDATFLEEMERDHFRRLAEQMGIPFVILSFCADPEELLRRVTRRSSERRDVSDADVGILQNQLRHYHTLRPDEPQFVISSDGSVQQGAIPLEEVIRQLRQNSA